ncbi:hypothetical protein ACFOY2_44770 [Nonomuraea purpurea]|uniref:Uncharacterized protein n=1 Tax=Nonomuraea purpurea TaxID=1849276 RepID=A0ABV8GKC7_9ACTN
MFKRRLATLGAVAVLAISGLAGSALADQTPTPSTAGAKMICKTADGKIVELASARAAAVTKDGKVRQLDPAEIEELKKAGEAGAVKKLADGKAVKVKDFVKGEGIQIRKIEGGEGVEVRKLERGEAGEWAKAKPVEGSELPQEFRAGPAKPAEGVTGTPQKTVKITCEKSD